MVLTEHSIIGKFDRSFAFALLLFSSFAPFLAPQACAYPGASSAIKPQPAYLFSCTTHDGATHVFWDVHDARDVHDAFPRTRYTILYGGAIKERTLSLLPIAVASGSAFIHMLCWHESNSSAVINYTRIDLSGNVVASFNLSIPPSSIGNIALGADSNDDLYLAWSEKVNGSENEEILCAVINNGSAPEQSRSLRITYDGAKSIKPSIIVANGTAHVLWFDETSGKFQLWYCNIAHGCTAAGTPKPVTSISTTRYPDYASSYFLARTPIVADAGEGLDVFWLDYRNNNQPFDKWAFDLYHERLSYCGEPLSIERRLTTHVREISGLTMTSNASVRLLAWREGSALYRMQVRSNEGNLEIFDGNVWQQWSANMTLEPSLVYRFASSDTAFSASNINGLGVLYTDMRDVNEWDYFPDEYCLFVNSEREARISHAGGQPLLLWTIIVVGISLPCALACAFAGRWKKKEALEKCSGLVACIPIVVIGAVILYFGYVDIELLELIAGTLVTPLGTILPGIFVSAHFRKAAVCGIAVALFLAILDILFWLSAHPYSLFY